MFIGLDRVQARLAPLGVSSVIPLGDAQMLALVKKLRRMGSGNEEGASLAEYGLLIALIAVVCVTAVTLLGTRISTVLTDAANSL